jgi:hypothetical protein
MKDELLEIHELLEARGDLKADLRGSGKSAFLYIQSHGVGGGPKGWLSKSL